MGHAVCSLTYELCMQLVGSTYVDGVGRCWDVVVYIIY